jgi:hypothetical protein
MPIRGLVSHVGIRGLAARSAATSGERSRMSVTRTTITLTLATALGLAGCGSSGSSLPQGQAVATPGTKPAALDAVPAAVANNVGSSRAQFSAFANAVNLRPQDMAGFTGKPKGAEHGSQLVNKLQDKAQYERCLGVGKETKAIYKRSSDKFEASSGLRFLSASSEVEVIRTKALAEKELTIARDVFESPKRRGCLTRAFNAMLGGSHTIHTGGHQVRITIGNTRIAPIPVGSAAAGTSGGFGMSVRMDVTYAVTVRGRSVTVPDPFYLDSLSFIVGRASVGLTTMTLGEPFPSEREASLFSLLAGRALNASRRSSAISQ